MNWKSFAKALVPAVVGLLAAIINSSLTGTVDIGPISEATAGLVAAILTYLVPNQGKPS